MKKILKIFPYKFVISVVWCPPALCEPTVGIIPFKNYSGDPSLDIVVQNATHGMSREISQIRGISIFNEKDIKDALQERVIREFLTSEKGKIIEGARVPSPAILVIGGLYAEGDTLILKARLVETATGEIFATVESRGNAKKDKSIIEGCVKGTREKVEAHTKGASSHMPEETSALPPHTVRVEGSGTSPSERAALILAKRNAVEKAVSSKVSIKNIPNQREVLSQAESTLSYEIASSKKEGKNYTIIIKAQVTIPPDILAEYGLEASPVTTGYKALKTSTRYGEVNWEEGFVIAHGRGTGKGPEEARRSALVEARARALEIVGGIPLDSEKTVKDFVSKEEKIAYEMKGLIEKSDILEEKKISDKEFEVSVKIPLVGIKGLSVLFIDALVPEKKAEEKTGGKTAAVEHDTGEEGYSGVVIDARGTGLRPSLFPKVSDNKGRVIHSPGTASRDSVQKKGMASFVTGEKKEAAETSPRREGRKPLIIKAKGVSGSMKANLILSSEDAEKLAKADKESGILKGSKVVIITDTPVGGTEG